jgi:hypothetical protein
MVETLASLQQAARGKEGEEGGGAVDKEFKQ